MEKLLKELSVIPGVTGSCVFDKIVGSLYTDLQTKFPKSLTESLGIHFVRLVQMGGMSNLNIKCAHFRFDRQSIVGVPLDTGAVLLIICDSQANSSFVAKTAVMLIADMNNAQSQGNNQVDPANLSPYQQELQKVYGQIEQALAAAIGPVAGMVVADYLDQWRESGPETLERLSELTRMLTDEIGDSELSQEFQNAIQHLL